MESILVQESKRLIETTRILARKFYGLGDVALFTKRTGLSKEQATYWKIKLLTLADSDVDQVKTDMRATFGIDLGVDFRPNIMAFTDLGEDTNVFFYITYFEISG